MEQDTPSEDGMTDEEIFSIELGWERVLRELRRKYPLKPRESEQVGEAPSTVENPRQGE